MVPLEQIMTTDLVTVSPDLSLQELAEILAAQGISGAPVVSGRELVGVISTSDVVEFDATTPAVEPVREDQVAWGEIRSAQAIGGREESQPGLYFTEMWDDVGADVRERFRSDTPEWNRMAEATVGSAMTTSVVSLPPGAAVQEASRIMLTAGIHRILVVDESGELVGLVSSSDIVQAVAERGLAEG